MNSKDKNTYSPSRLTHYVKCAKSFYLSRHHKADIGSGTQLIMRDGQLFEGYVLGFKPDQNEKELIGRKKPATIDFIKGHAEHVQPIFESGESYVFMSLETQDYIARGEIDYIGKINREAFEKATCQELPHEFDKVIIDLKYTKDAPRVWDFKDKKEDYLQAVFYTWLVWKNTGNLLPFMYLIVENKYEVPVVRAVYFEITEHDVLWLEDLINVADDDIFYEPDPSHENCLGGKMGGRCWYLQHCEKGRKLAGGIKTIEFSDLFSKF